MSDFLMSLVSIFMLGVAIGFAIGFIAWAIGFGIYGIIRLFKMV